MKTMKTKLIALALLALGTVQAQATVLLSESFDDVSALPGAGWQIFNDGTPGGSTTWFQGNDAVFGPHEGTGYVAANFNAAPAGGFIALYLISPELFLSDGDTITFWTRGEGESPFADVLGVGIKDSDVPPWLVVNPTGDFGGYPGEWTQYTAVIAGLGASPRPTRFSFLYYGYADDLNYIGIDSVEVNHVPEPGTLMLLGLGLAGLGFARRRNVA
jgi:hypothetical protein